MSVELATRIYPDAGVAEQLAGITVNSCTSDFLNQEGHLLIDKCEETLATVTWMIKAVADRLNRASGYYDISDAVPFLMGLEYRRIGYSNLNGDNTHIPFQSSENPGPEDWYQSFSGEGKIDALFRYIQQEIEDIAEKIEGVKELNSLSVRKPTIH